MDLTEGGTPARIRARVGEPFIVELSAKPTAGYSWRAELAGSHLELVDERHRPAGEPPGMGGIVTFVFVPRAPGEDRIRFVYGRSWEAAPLEERIVVVEAE
jgi:predicted secreted protein